MFLKNLLINKELYFNEFERFLSNYGFYTKDELKEIKEKKQVLFKHYKYNDTCKIDFEIISNNYEWEYETTFILKIVKVDIKEFN